MDQPLDIKPHHLVDIVTALGRGVEKPPPHPYGHAVHTVTAHLLAQPWFEVCLELGADAICAPCRHYQQGRCLDRIDTSFRPAAPTSKQEWNLLLDQRWCARLGLEPNQRLTAAAFCRKLQDRAGDIAGIYREEPAARSADRQANLRTGIRLFLERASRA